MGLIKVMANSRFIGIVSGICLLTNAHATELLDFSLVLPPTVDQHVLVRPAVAWEVRDDAASHCERLQGHDGFAVWKQGCVYWQKAQPACTIVTTGRTSHSVMGHLFLLCLKAGEPS